LSLRPEDNLDTLNEITVWHLWCLCKGFYEVGLSVTDSASLCLSKRFLWGLSKGLAPCAKSQYQIYRAFGKKNSIMLDY
jgi:hypothetical protein